MAQLTSKQKIDQALGITDGQSIDDFLNGLSIDNTDQLSSSFENIGSEIRENLNQIDQSIQKNEGNIDGSILEIKNLDLSMKEVEELIGISKALFRHVYEQSISTSLCDSELIGATAKLLEAIHVNIAEFIQMFKDKQKYIEKVKLKLLDHEHKKELLQLKYKYEKELLQKEVIDVTENQTSYSYDAILEMLNKQDNEKAEN